MQINLKQVEIIAALKQYIAGQGISLQGKSVEMAFTAGRKEAGISVEISIEDVSLPDFGLPEEDQVTAPKLTLIADPEVTSTASIAVAASGVVIEAQTEEEERVATPAPALPVSNLFS